MGEGVLNIWVSDYGDFQIPDYIYHNTPWKINKKGVTVGVLPVQESRHFWNWLHDSEVAAGKTREV